MTTDRPTPLSMNEASLDANWADANRSKSRTPELALLTRILEDAIEHATSPGSKACAESRSWIESTTDDYIFDFETICTALGINASAVRAKIMARAEYLIAPKYPAWSGVKPERGRPKAA